MPEEGLAWLPGEELLTAQELGRVISLAVDEGVTKVRFTGGEPFLRKDLVEIVAGVSELDRPPSISLTTNGIGLAARAQDLRDAGLRRINISLDTLDPGRFMTLTRRDRIKDVFAGIDAALAAGLDPVKLNTVLMRGVNDDEALDLTRWSLRTGVHLRFIEQMPLDPQHAWSREEMVTVEEILQSLSTELEVVPHDAPRGSEPAEKWQVTDPSTASPERWASSVR